MLSTSGDAAGGYARGRLGLREQDIQRPLQLLLLVLFLQEQEKNGSFFVR
jgi:hypothetical protein